MSERAPLKLDSLFIAREYRISFVWSVGQCVFAGDSCSMVCAFTQFSAFAVWHFEFLREISTAHNKWTRVKNKENSKCKMVFFHNLLGIYLRLLRINFLRFSAIRRILCTAISPSELYIYMYYLTRFRCNQNKCICIMYIPLNFNVCEMTGKLTKINTSDIFSESSLQLNSYRLQIASWMSKNCSVDLNDFQAI